MLAMSDDLVTWLRAQLDEDERVARDCPSPDWELGIVYGSVIARTGGRIALEAPSQSIADHIAQHDPARVLIEVEAKRRIVDLHSRSTCRGHERAYSTHGVQTCDADAEDWPCETVQLLALPYADRPGYDERWRP
jgi:hypothetical protein